MDEKLEFSNRLRTAMEAAGYEPRASVIENEFNQRWWGRSISMQAAWSWLNGKAIPSQDKLQTLAEWLKVEPQILRFGEGVVKSVREYRQRWDEKLTYLERETVDAYLQLPAPQRKVVREVILTFAKVYKDNEDTPSSS
ncbi:transcriptional regulator [Sphaerotilus sp.]|uniref:transcriptional regulator n=1 Tax=Sphaerotilus sp. TaxID=2093942 RepID=UPI0034E27400